MDSKSIENYLSHTTHHFGEIEIGKTVSAIFTYTGTQEIKEINTSCFCLSTRKTKFLDRTEIKVSWNVKPTPKINKPSKKKVDIIFDNDDEITLTLTGTIINEIPSHIS